MHTKIVLLFIVSFFVSFGSFFYMWEAQERDLKAVQVVRVAEFKNSFEEIVSLKNKRYVGYIYDNTYWDEMLSFLNTQNEEWAEVNILEPMNVQEYDYAVVYDSKGKTVYYHQKNDSSPSIKNKLAPEAFDMKTPLFSNYFISIDGTLVEIFTAPIQPSDDAKRETKPQGYYALGKIWTDEYIADFAKITKQTVEIAKENTKNGYDFLYPLKSYENSEIGYLGIKLSSTTLDEVNSIFKVQFYAMLIVGFVTMLFISVILYFIVAKPLEILSKIIATRDVTHLAKYINQNDPLGDIAKAIQQLFNKTAILNQYKAAIDFGHIVSKTDKEGVITYVNKEFEKISGYSASELIGQKHSIVKHPESPKELFESLWKAITNGEIFKSIIKNKAKNGRTYYVRSIIAPIYDSHREIIEYISIRTDITELFEQMEFITKQIITDSMTLLPNKEQLKLDMSQNAKQTFALLNIDGFRGINESFGYEAGDKLLVMFAESLKKLAPQKAKVYRISGDEFGILFENLDNINFEDTVGEIIKKLEHEPFVIEESEVSLRIRCALATGTHDVRKKCDISMYFAKEHNISLVTFEKNSQIQEEIEHSRKMTAMVQDAIKHDCVQAFGQKVVDSLNKQNFKVETLMRIVDKDGNVIAPMMFLEQAKKARLYTKLTQIMIQKSFEYFQNNKLDFSLNFTFEDILDEDTVDKFFKLIEKYEMHNRVIIELVESEELSSIKEVDEFVKKAKSYGCKISIDDFGSGYSNFEYLLNIGADYIKIDGTLIKNIDTDKNAYMLVKTIVSLAKNLELKIVAEFVHSESVQAVVESLGIDFLQGYHLHQPESLDKIV
jgi:PAS domain S-box-containing protein/diguanylate cyclase (GGDEF)-like protein